MSETRKAVHEPLVRIVKRDGISFKNKALIRAASIVLDEFRAGKLGRLTLEEAPCEKQQPSD